ncbi:hypothetical protein C8R47DRAFT_1193970 [Mycena vitilis]|nr:hypothetical protein C8R47DRAFT_1193970 [Mycena vitilis]
MDIIDLTDSMTILNEHISPTFNSLVYDVLFRPVELEDVPMWDQFSLYEKIRISQAKKSQSNNNEDSDIEEDDLIPNNQFYFSTGHPQKSTHLLRKRKVMHIPVLSGTPIPRRDIEEHADKYAVVMLTLFRPWNRSASDPLKSEASSWKTAIAEFLLSASHSYIKIMDHMQEQWECRLAADDFSAEYKARQANFNTPANSSSHLDAANDLAQDLDWQLGQLDEAIGPESNPDAPETDFDEFFEACGPRTRMNTDAAIALAGTANFYHVPAPPDNICKLIHGHVVESRDDTAHVKANAASLLLAEEKSLALSNHALHAQLLNLSATSHHRTAVLLPVQPRLSTLAEEKESARLRISKFQGEDNSLWDQLREWKKTAVAVIDKFTLNKKQRLAFLLKVNARMNDLVPNPDREPFRLIISVVLALASSQKPDIPSHGSVEPGQAIPRA